MSGLRLERLTRRYGAAAAVEDMALEVAEGEMVVLLGPSGCGKTTTLRMIAGFVQPSAGDILLDGRSILDLPAHKRDMGIVFQSYALFPHLSAARNIGFGLEMRRQPRAAVAQRTDEMLRMVKLEAFADRLPRQLSGGQQQRVALARALAIHPKVLLLDEPLSNLDAALRQDVGREIRILQRDAGLTAIMVTHDQDEAMAMADRLVVMKDGRVQQIGAQADLYERPANAFVARFIGGSTMLDGTLASASELLLGDGGRITLAGRYAGSGSCTLALRPERVALAGHAEASGGGAEGAVELSTYLGAVMEHVVRIAPQAQSGETRIIVRDPTTGGAKPRAPGERVAVCWGQSAERLFDAAGQPMAAFLSPKMTIRETSNA